MTEEARTKLLEHKEWLARPKGVWSTDDLKWAYDTYALITGENKKDQGCNSCRRQVIETLRFHYNKIIEQELKNGI